MKNLNYEHNDWLQNEYFFKLLKLKFLIRNTIIKILFLKIKKEERFQT